MAKNQNINNRTNTVLTDSIKTLKLVHIPPKNNLICREFTIILTKNLTGKPVKLFKKADFFFFFNQGKVWHSPKVIKDDTAGESI